jgi:hypothetical protein
MEAAADGLLAVAIAFVDPSVDTRGALERVCRESAAADSLPRLIG